VLPKPSIPAIIITVLATTHVDMDSQVSTDGNAPSKVLSPSSMAHVVLRTSPENFNAMVSFYTTFLGGHIAHANSYLAFLTYDHEHHRIAILAHRSCTNSQAPRSSSPGLEHIAFSFDSLADLVLAYKQRKALGMLPIWCVNHGPTTSMYYEDPDGNQIETQVDNFDSVEETDRFMKSEAFNENPIGADFEAEELVRKVEAGEDERVIKVRGDVGPRAIEAH
jgi:catechol-2,3-dioxygenase